MDKPSESLAESVPELASKDALGAALHFEQVTRIFERRVRAAGVKASLGAFFRPEVKQKRALANVSFSIPRGSCVGLVGANGAGKTTLLKIASGLLHPTSGQAHALGFTPADRNKKFLKSIGMVMGQKSQLWVDIPAAETFELLADIYEVPKDAFRERLANLARILKVEDLLGVQVRRLSLGERMKCEIIASLLHSPELVFLDEPTIGLDVVAKGAIREFIIEHNRKSGATIVLSSHDMSDITEVCDRLLLIHEGQLLYSGTLADFQAHYQVTGAAEDLERIVRQVLMGNHEGLPPPGMSS